MSLVPDCKAIVVLRSTEIYGHVRKCSNWSLELWKIGVKYFNEVYLVYGKLDLFRISSAVFECSCVLSWQYVYNKGGRTFSKLPIFKINFKELNCRYL